MRFLSIVLGMYLDGSEIRLRDRPMKDPGAYFSRKKIYGFNLQAICNQQGRFIYAHGGYTASAHDSTAFKGDLVLSTTTGANEQQRVYPRG